MADTNSKDDHRQISNKVTGNNSQINNGTARDMVLTVTPAVADAPDVASVLQAIAAARKAIDEHATELGSATDGEIAKEDLEQLRTEVTRDKRIPGRIHDQLNRFMTTIGSATVLAGALDALKKAVETLTS